MDPQVVEHRRSDSPRRSPRRSGASRTAVAAGVAIEGLDGPWLPAPGMPEAVSLNDVWLDQESGSLASVGGVRSGLRYHVSGRVDSPTDTDLAVAAVPAETRYLGLPRLPYLFADFTQRVVQGAGTPFERAVLIEGAVRTGRRLDPDAPAGSSYARLETFLFGRSGQPGAQAGTSEQFATAFAVLARAARLPTRVVFGFAPGERQPDGRWLVRGRDALAWPEVYFSGLGWVPFDPSPQAPDTTGPSRAAKEQILNGAIAPPTEPRPTASVVQPVPSTTVQAAPAGAAAGATGGPFRLVLPATGIALAAVLGLVLGARRLRRAGHRRRGARARGRRCWTCCCWPTAGRPPGIRRCGSPATSPWPIRPRRRIPPYGWRGGRTGPRSAQHRPQWTMSGPRYGGCGTRSGGAPHGTGGYGARSIRARAGAAVSR
jgi:hypothetical protein